jgi:hypothetical protein
MLWIWLSWFDEVSNNHCWWRRTRLDLKLSVNLRVRLLVRKVQAKPPSHAGDSAAKVTLVVAWCHCRVVLAMTLPSRHWSWRDVVAESCWRLCYRGDVGCDMMSLPILAGNVVVESCWWWHCRGNVGHGAISLPSHAGDGTVEVTLVVVRCHCRVLLAMVLSRRRWSWHDVAAESCWWWRCRVLLAMALSRWRWSWHYRQPC